MKVNKFSDESPAFIGIDMGTHLDKTRTACAISKSGEVVFNVDFSEDYPTAYKEMAELAISTDAVIVVETNRVGPMSYLAEAGLQDRLFIDNGNKWPGITWTSKFGGNKKNSALLAFMAAAKSKNPGNEEI